MTMGTPTSTVQIAHPGTAIYMLHWGEHYERRSSGPYLGVPGLDFAARSDDYRRASYAAAEAAKEDQCSLDESDFQKWLVGTGILAPIEAAVVDIEVRAYGHECVPKHWPVCPDCETARGEQEYGAVRRSLNRITSYHRCTECRHEWGHHEVANNSSAPMLDDDGRDTEGGCVPFAISKACAIDWKVALAVCTKHGWNRSGLSPDKAIIAVRELGFDLVRQSRSGVGVTSGPTLKRLITELPRNRNYVVAVKDHWIAVVNGMMVDNDTNSGPGRKALELYEVRSAQSAAA